MTHPTVGHPAGLPDDPRADVTAPTPECPVEITLAALHGRWTTLVIRELLRGDHSYSELRAALPVMSDKVLSDRLAHLTRAGVVDRDRRPGWPPRVRYTLTPNGHRLGPVLQALWDWGAHLPTPAGEADPSRTTGFPSTRLRTYEDAPSPRASVGDEVFGQ
ncbi:winged helix-turn-helix transcriptional regulator [Streptomyces sp. NPDC054808]